MKITKRNRTLSLTIALISVLSISIASTAIRSNKTTHAKFYSRPVSEAGRVYPPAVVKYQGELIPVVQLPEVTIRDTAAKKKEVKK
jgi:hypothetical protein